MLSRASISGANPPRFRDADSISLSSEPNPCGVRAPLIDLPLSRRAFQRSAAAASLGHRPSAATLSGRCVVALPSGCRCRRGCRSPHGPLLRSGRLGFLSNFKSRLRILRFFTNTKDLTAILSDSLQDETYYVLKIKWRDHTPSLLKVKFCRQVRDW